MGLLPSIKTPRFKLPKLRQLALGVPATLIAGFTLVKKFSLITSFINSSLTPLQSKLKQLNSIGFSGVGNGLKSAVSNAINSVAGLIKNQVQGLVNSALNAVTAAVSNAKTIVQTLINQINGVKDELSKSAKSVKKMCEDEIDLDETDNSAALGVAAIQTSITKTVKKDFELLDNKQQKELIEDPAKKEQFVNSVTDKSIKASEKTLENQANQKTQYKENVSTVNKLTTPVTKIEYDILYEQPVRNLENASRLTLIGYLKQRLSSNSLSYFPIKRYPELKAPVEAEIARIESDIALNKENYSAKLYIKNPEYIQLR